MNTGRLRRHLKAVFDRRQIASRLRERVLQGIDPTIAGRDEDAPRRRH